VPPTPEGDGGAAVGGGRPVRELVAYLCRSIAERPDDVRVEESREGGALVLDVRVAPADMGRIIGRQGRVIGAIRTLARSFAPPEERRVVVRVQDPPRGGEA
jgi:predicted RNA-binding protein YlqC (UPF0109 family)